MSRALPVFDVKIDVADHLSIQLGENQDLGRIVPLAPDEVPPIVLTLAVLAGCPGYTFVVGDLRNYGRERRCYVLFDHGAESDFSTVFQPLYPGLDLAHDSGL
jgi:hypothetical protein